MTERPRVVPWTLFCNSDRPPVSGLAYGRQRVRYKSPPVENFPTGGLVLNRSAAIATEF